MKKKRGMMDFKKKKAGSVVREKTKPLDQGAKDKIATVIAGAIVLFVIAGIGILLLSIGGGAYRYAVDSSKLVLQKIEVEGNSVLEPNEMMKLSGLKPGEEILLIDLPAVKERIMTNPRVASAVVERHLPNRILIKIVERVPIGLIQVGSEIKGIDRDGVVVPLIPAREEVKGPIITGQIANLPHETVLEALEAIERMRPDLIQKISELRILNDGFTLFTTGEPTLIRMGRGKMPEKVERLRTSLKYFEETSQRKQMIDLRFEDIVTVP